MTKTFSSPPDAPQVQVDVQTPFYKGTQKVDVQTNRADPVSRFAWKWLNWLYLPADPADFALDAGSYLLGAALITSISQHFVWIFALPVIQVLVSIAVVAALVLGWFIVKEVKRGWILLLFRLTLVLTGFILGGIL